MVRRLVLPKRLHRQRMIHFARLLKDRPAELHATLHDARAVRASDPLECLRRVLLRRSRRVVLQGDLVEPQPDLGVGIIGELVQRTKGVNVGQWKRGVRLDSLKEYD